MQGKRAAVYPRVSSKNQEDNYSISTQLAACLSHAEQLGYEVDERHVYREVHTGIDFWQRPKMTELRQAIRAGELDAVIFYSVDRYARDPVFHMLGLAEARQYGVRFHIVTEDLDLSDDDDVLMFFLRGYSAKREWRDLRERSTRGRRARAREGKLISRPKPLYGYHFADDEHARYIRYEPEAVIVRRIVERYLRGHAINRIRIDLNDDGIPSPSGKAHWSHTTIHRILTTHDYTGRGSSWKGEYDIGGDVIPAIITEDEFAQVAAMLKRNKQFSMRNTLDPEAALLRGGFIRCGYCGRVVQTIRGRNGAVYRCYGHNDRPGDCPGVSILTHLVDEPVWDRVWRTLTRADVIEDELDRLVKDDPTVADLAAVEKAIREAERQQGNLSQAIGMVDHPDAIAPLTHQLQGIAQHLQQLRLEREAVLQRRSQWHAAQDRLQDVQRWRESIASRLDGATWEQKRLALSAAGAQVTLYRKEHEPRYRLEIAIGALANETVSHTTCRAAILRDACGC